MTNSEALVRIFYKPREAFRTLKEDRYWFLAALLVGLLSCAIWMVPAAWRSSVSPPPQIEESHLKIDALDQDAIGLELNSGTDTSTPNQLNIDYGFNQPAKITPIYYRNWFLYLTVRFVPLTLIFLFGFFFVEALYFRLIGSFVSPDFTVGDWYRFSIWSRLPALLFSVIFTVLAKSSGAFEPTLQPDNLLALARWVEMPDAYLRNGLFSMRTIDVGLVWVVALQTIGIREWCCLSTITSCVIAVTPVVLFYAIGTLWFYTIGGL